MAASKKKVTVVMEDPQPKKSVVRFDNEDTEAALGNVYVRKSAMDEIGNPERIKVTIEAA